MTEEGDTPRAAKLIDSMRAAQVCLVSHHFSRRGARPWGIQRTLDLNDMCVVVEGLGLILITLITLFEAEHYDRYAKILLADVDMILTAMARSRSIGVAELVSEYFMSMMLKE